MPYYRVDHVSYRTNAPWPQIPAGTSLERLPLAAYGNDPAYWRAGPIQGTPGVPAANRLPVITLMGPAAVHQQALLTLFLTAADLDVPWQTVSLYPTELPPGSTFDPALGVLSWTPAPSQSPGDYVARFTAADSSACGANLSSLEFSIQVAQPLTITAKFIGGDLEFGFVALSGETYRVEYCTDLTLADWALLQEIAPTQTGVVTISDPDFGLGAARFYRVRWIR